MFDLILCVSFLIFFASNVEANCNTPSPPAGYIFDNLPTGPVADDGTNYAVSCDNDNGYTGTTPDQTCSAVLGGYAWNGYSGCTLSDCGSVTDPSNGVYTLNAGTAGGDTASVDCDTDFTASAATITCLHTGAWTVETCDAVDCGSQSITDGVYAYSGTGVDDTATLTCDTNYENNGVTSVITCLETGNWDNTLTCTQLASCPPPQFTSGYEPVSDDYELVQGTEIEIVCAQSYAGNPANIVCQADATWSALVDCTAVVQQNEYDSALRSSYLSFGNMLLLAALGGITVFARV